MRSVARMAATFVILYLAFSAVAALGVPELIAWNRRNCLGETSPTCSASILLLSYWWLAVTPALVVLSILLNRVVSRRRAA